MRSVGQGDGGVSIAPLRPNDPPSIGPFRLAGRLGAGGMGQVFLGRNSSGRWVAVKVIHDAHLSVPEFRQRFAREIEVAERVRAPWTVTLIDADPRDRRPWLATEYVPGPSLEQAVTKGGPLAEPSLGVLASRLADALAGLHSTGLVHRDLKPSNVMLATDGPRLLDFGIVRASDATRITRTGLAVGTPAYMSPEQAHGQDGGPPSDVFSLASVLTFAAAGSGPFGTGVNPVALLVKVAEHEPDLSGLPETIREELVDCLNKDPQGRPTARQLASALAHWTTPKPPPGSWPPPVVAELTAPPPDLVEHGSDRPGGSGTGRTGQAGSADRRPGAPDYQAMFAPVRGRAARSGGDIPAGLTPSSTALRSLTGLFRAGRRPRPIMIGLLVLPIVLALVLALVLLVPWSGRGALGPNGAPVAGGPNSPPPEVRGVKLGAATPLATKVAQVSANPRGGQVVVSDGSNLAVLDPASLIVLNQSALSSYASQVHVGPDGTSYAVESTQVEMFGPGGVRSGAIPLPANTYPNASRLSADGRKLAILTKSGDAATMWVVDTTAGTVNQFPLPNGKFVWSFEVSPDGAAAYLTRSADGVWRLDLTNGLVMDVPAALNATALAVSIDGRALYAVSANLISTLDPQTGAFIRRAAVPGYIGGILPMRGGQLAVVDGTRHVLKVINPGTGDVLATAPVANTLYSGDDLATDGQRIFTRHDSIAETMAVTEN